MSSPSLTSRSRLARFQLTNCIRSQTQGRIAEYQISEVQSGGNCDQRKAPTRFQHDHGKATEFFSAASSLANQQDKCSSSYQHRNQNTDDERNNRMPTTLDFFRSSAFLRHSETQPEEKFVHRSRRSSQQSRNQPADLKSSSCMAVVISSHRSTDAMMNPIRRARKSTELVTHCKRPGG